MKKYKQESLKENLAYNLKDYHVFEEKKSKFIKLDNIKITLKDILPNIIIKLLKTIKQLPTTILNIISDFFGRKTVTKLSQLENSIKDIRDYMENEIFYTNTINHQDIISILLKLHPVINEKPNINVKTDDPVATDSPDHLFPEGTAVDYTRSSRFCKKCEDYFARKISFCDIGCAGGGLVLDFLLNGHFAIGIEGSDYSLKSQRAGWKIIPNYLFTSDITKPFSIIEQKNLIKKFDVISAWEVLEHIHKDDLVHVFDNVSKHLSSNGIFIGSIGIKPSSGKISRVPLHLTVEKPDWWMNTFNEFGFKLMDNHPFEFLDFCRGTGNGYRDPNFKKNRNGCHFVVQKK